MISIFLKYSKISYLSCFLLLVFRNPVLKVLYRLKSLIVSNSYQERGSYCLNLLTDHFKEFRNFMNLASLIGAKLVFYYKDYNFGWCLKIASSRIDAVL